MRTQLNVFSRYPSGELNLVRQNDILTTRSIVHVELETAEHVYLVAVT